MTSHNYSYIHWQSQGTAALHVSELRPHRRTIGHAPLYTGIGYTPGMGMDIINIDPLPPKEVYL